ncbi:RNA polymerase sigma factor [Ruminococcus flavefaciens]|uniref:RNA polymerase sigma-70 region 2 domain-containing protein n=1 Tax=Ruminococcus flavefaciens 007c TaxID=1341157 RepID=W7UEI0_RUMFL|nr:RNA polymerase sigma factor [Ruminococcus flavefaciens]EWM52338.1 hypothetical protein RF007C_13385 [Ruminococcus flavefaciens 007c]
MDNGASSYRRFREEGDLSGLAEIIRDYKDELILYIFSIVGNIHTAEDIAEDTFVLLGTKKPRDKGKGQFRTWLYTIGRHLAIDNLRKLGKLTAVSVDDAPELISDEEDLETSYIREERKIAVHRAMRRLIPQYRQVLGLIYFEGFSIKEAAERPTEAPRTTAAPKPTSPPATAPKATSPGDTPPSGHLWCIRGSSISCNGIIYNDSTIVPSAFTRGDYLGKVRDFQGTYGDTANYRIAPDDSVYTVRETDGVLLVVKADSSSVYGSTIIMCSPDFPSGNYEHGSLVPNLPYSDNGTVFEYN